LTKIKVSYNIVLPVKFAGIFPERRVKTMSHMLSVATHRNGQWRRPLALAGVIVALALALVFGPSAKATPAEAAPANPAVITLYSPAPYWLSEILKRTVGKEAANRSCETWDLTAATWLDQCAFKKVRTTRPGTSGGQPSRLAVQRTT
jgi:hypothetical protein